MADVDTDVEPVMVPSSMVVATPLTVGVHFCYVVVNLMAVFAASSCVMIYSGAVRFEAVAAIVVPVVVGSGRSGPSC